MITYHGGLYTSELDDIRAFYLTGSFFYIGVIMVQFTSLMRVIETK